MSNDDSTPAQRAADAVNTAGVWTAWELRGSHFAAQWLIIVFAELWPDETMQDGCDAR